MFHQIESKMLSCLSGRMTADELAAKCSLPVSSVLSFSQSLREKGYVSVSSEEGKSLSLTPEGARYLKEGLPELRVFAAAQKGAAVASLSQEERSIGLPWASRNSWVKVDAGKLSPLCPQLGDYDLEISLQRISQGQEPSEASLISLIKRKLVMETISKTIYLEPTAMKVEQSDSGVNALTREMLLSGSWHGANFREYDTNAMVDVPDAAKRHIISRLKKRVSTIFTEMGFEEMQGNEIQSAFWNFDALFQPQDHPARDLADTFYLKENAKLPDDAELVGKIKKVQEKCWGGEWKEETASQGVLRTHTTAVSAAYLYNECRASKAPKKYFSIGKVYRNEATDYKHLAEFFQVEGIVVSEGATFRDLLGCLREFYQKLGFEKIRFQPSYFPYTEPSLEISVYFEKKKQWIELGGAGIFRPEVSIPLCDRYPVLAWGLSLERPLMMLNDFDDIRDFYKSSIGWIRGRTLK
jgi:phenylalanyl-tRNA synthetase alpha chain